MHVDRPGGVAASGERAQERGLAVADDAGDPHDLSLAGGERDVVETASAEPFDLKERRLAGVGQVLRREGGLECAADDHREEVGVRDVRDAGRPPERAVAKDRDAIGDLANLAQPVGDVHDGRPVGGEPAHEAEEELDGILRQRSRRLVEDQEPRRHRKRLGDLEEVAAGDAERRHAVREMPLEVHVVEQRAHRLRHVGIAASQILDRDCNPDVLGDGHVGQERGMLMDHRDPEALRQRRREAVDGRAVEDDRAGVRRRRAGGDVHQRRLAGAVLAEQGVHLAREDVERDVGERRHAVVVLRDAEHRQRRLPGGAALLGTGDHAGFHDG